MLSAPGLAGGGVALAAQGNAGQRRGPRVQQLCHPDIRGLNPSAGLAGAARGPSRCGAEGARPHGCCTRRTGRLRARANGTASCNELSGAVSSHPRRGEPRCTQGTPSECSILLARWRVRLARRPGGGEGARWLPWTVRPCSVHAGRPTQKLCGWPAVRASVALRSADLVAQNRLVERRSNGCGASPSIGKLVRCISLHERWKGRRAATAASASVGLTRGGPLALDTPRLQPF